MDGQRARRLKCGTPIGRIVDEAGDAVQYTWVSMIMGFVMRVDPGWLCLSFALINMPMYSMEIKFILTGTLSITAGGDALGPVEMELLFTLIFVICAIFGVHGLSNPVSDVFSFMPDTFEWKHLLAVFFLILLLLFTFENLLSSFKIAFCKTLHYMMNPILTILNAAVAGYLGLYTFKYQFVVFFLLHNMAFNISSYRLMISNMCKSKFSILGWEHIFVVIPTLVWLTKYIDAIDISEYERFVTYGCTGALYVLFYIHIWLLAQQYLARGENKNFWVIRKR